MSAAAAAAATTINETEDARNARISRDEQIAARDKFTEELLGPVGNEIQKDVTVMTSDEMEVSIPISIYGTSTTLMNMLEDIGWSTGDEPVPLPNVTKETLENYIKFVEGQWPNERKRPYANCPTVDDENEDESEMVEPNKVLEAIYLNSAENGQASLFQLILACNFLDFNKGLNMCCAHVATMIRNKSPEEIRQIFKIINKEASPDAEGAAAMTAAASTVDDES